MHNFQIVRKNAMKSNEWNLTQSFFFPYLFVDCLQVVAGCVEKIQKCQDETQS